MIPSVCIEHIYNSNIDDMHILLNLIKLVIDY